MAIELAKKALRGNPDQLTPYLTFAASYSFLNRTEEASKAIQEILRMHPHFTVDHHSNIVPFRNQEELDKYINALRKAGLPE